MDYARKILFALMMGSTCLGIITVTLGAMLSPTKEAYQDSKIINYALAACLTVALVSMSIILTVWCYSI